MRKKVYIRSAGIISPQDSFGVKHDYANVCVYEGGRMQCLEPDYKNILDPKLIRRMSRIIRMGAAAAMECIAQSANLQPDAVITGTAYGCLEDTVNFLDKMVANKEELLTPTAFIQSTHNTVAAQIALMLKSHKYNNTFVHRGCSFEHALIDALLLMNEGEAANVLVGAVDEITDTSHTILSRFGLYRNNGKNTSLLETDTKGTMSGEGAAFFLLSAESDDQCIASLDDLSTLYDPSEKSDVLSWISQFLEKQKISWNDLDFVLSGKNGDQKHDLAYSDLERNISKQCRLLNFKHLCGEYPTAVSFGFWLAAKSLKDRSVPFRAASEQPVISKGRILLYNRDLSGHHSLILFSAC